MKILLLNNSSLTLSCNDFCVDSKTGTFAKELEELNNEVTLFGQKVKAKDNITMHSYELNKNGLYVIGLWRRKNKLLNHTLLFLRIIPEIIKSDFIYIFYPTSFKYVTFLCKLFSRRYGIYIRGEQGIYDSVSHWIYKNAYTVFTVSDHFTGIINDLVGRKVANTILPMIPYTEKDVINGREYKVKQKYRILFLGRIVKDKGIEELLKAVNILKNKGCQFELNLVGNGEFMEVATSLVQKLRIEDIANLNGAVYETEKVKAYYMNADIYILPTYHEGFPRTLYEAMIYGTPVITTFVGGIPALMKDNYNCKKIIPKSVESIVTTIDEVLNNYLIMEPIVRNATNTIKQILNPSRLTHAQDLNRIISIKKIKK